MSETKQAPLPPNGTRNRYSLERRADDQPTWRTARMDPRTLDNLRWLLATPGAVMRRPWTNEKLRITTRLADGRKLVIR